MLTTFSRSRIAWALLTLGAAALLGIALYFQYQLNMAPCVMCVYQRAALTGVILAGILGWLAPQHSLLSNVALLGWLGSASYGVLLAKQHVAYQFNPSPFTQCSTTTEFPHWLLLDQWLPSVFRASGDCSDISWSWLDLSMPQWLLGIFYGLAALAVLFIFARFITALRGEPSRRNWNKY